MAIYDDDFLIFLKDPTNELSIDIETKTKTIIIKMKAYERVTHSALSEKTILHRFASILAVFISNTKHSNDNYRQDLFKNIETYKEILAELFTELAYYVKNKTLCDNDTPAIARLIYEIAQTIELFNKLSITFIGNTTDDQNQLLEKLFNSIKPSSGLKNLEMLDLQRILIALRVLIDNYRYHFNVDWRSKINEIFINSVNDIIKTVVEKKAEQTMAENQQGNIIIFTGYLLNYLLSLSKIVKHTDDQIKPALWVLLEKVITHISKNKNNINFIKGNSLPILLLIYRLCLLLDEEREHFMGLTPTQQNTLATLFKLCLDYNYYSHIDEYYDVIRLAFSFALLNLKLELPPFRIDKEIVKTFIEYCTTRLNDKFHSTNDFASIPRGSLNRLGCIYDWFIFNYERSNTCVDTHKKIYQTPIKANDPTKDAWLKYHVEMYHALWKNKTAEYSLKVICMGRIGFHDVPIFIIDGDKTIACLISNSRPISIRKNNKIAAYLRTYEIPSHTIYLNPSNLLGNGQNNEQNKQKTIIMENAISYILKKHFSKPLPTSQITQDPISTVFESFESEKEIFNKTLNELEKQVDQLNIQGTSNTLNVSNLKEELETCFTKLSQYFNDPSANLPLKKRLFAKTANLIQVFKTELNNLNENNLLELFYEFSTLTITINKKFSDKERAVGCQAIQTILHAANTFNVKNDISAVDLLNRLAILSQENLLLSLNGTAKEILNSSLSQFIQSVKGGAAKLTGASNLLNSLHLLASYNLIDVPTIQGILDIIIESFTLPQCDGQISQDTDNVIALLSKLALLSHANVPLSFSARTKQKLNNLLKPLLLLLQLQRAPLEYACSLLRSTSHLARNGVIDNLHTFIQLALENACQQYMNCKQQAQVVCYLDLYMNARKRYLSTDIQYDLLKNILLHVTNPQSYYSIAIIDTLEATRSLSRIDIPEAFRPNQAIMAQFRQFIFEASKDNDEYKTFVQPFFNWYELNYPVQCKFTKDRKNSNDTSPFFSLIKFPTETQPTEYPPYKLF